MRHKPGESRFVKAVVKTCVHGSPSEMSDGDIMKVYDFKKSYFYTPRKRNFIEM